ncbi:MAG: hypothetical protein P9M06_05330, partial [Candidatus Saelkia tenebricola]|nr:hypothetical protein [Candidatus Saelkia tenebricola]
MLTMFKRKWFWITVIVLIINIAGLSKIISVLESKQGYKSSQSISTSIGKKIRQLIWPVKKVTQDVAKKLNLQEDFKVKYIKPSMSDLTPSIYIRLSHSIDLDKIKGYIEVSPKVISHAEKSYSGITLYGKFLPGESYTVEILKGMPSTRGVLLKETLKKEVVIPDYEATFNFKVPGIYMSLQGSKILPVEATNVDKLKVKVHKVYANNIVYLLNNITSYNFPDDLGVDLFEKEITTKCERNKPREVLL